jgi:hypothetical protein
MTHLTFRAGSRQSRLCRESASLQAAQEQDVERNVGAVPCSCVQTASAFGTLILRGGLPLDPMQSSNSSGQRIYLLSL